MYENEEMLKNIRLDRPNQVINEVISVSKDEHIDGLYNVTVDMPIMFFETTILHNSITLPYPLNKFENLSDLERMKWRNFVDNKI
jgi:hypothetical protein